MKTRLSLISLFAATALCFALLLSGCAASTDTPGEADATAATTAPTAQELSGTGGDENACEVHQFSYHAIDGALIDYIGEEKMNEFIAAYSGTGEDCNIISFVNFCGLTREQFIEAEGWGDKLDEPAGEHASGPYYVYGETAPYTYCEFVDAIYGDDAALSARIFSADIFDDPATTEPAA